MFTVLVILGLNTFYNEYFTDGTVSSFAHGNNQFLLLQDHGRYIRSDHKNTSIAVILQLRFTKIEILKRRNKKERPCFNKWRRLDDLVMMKHLQAAGCRAPYHNSSEPLCNMTNKTREAKVEFHEIKNKYHPLPCQEMSNIAFTVDVMADRRKNGRSSPQIYIMYPDKIKIKNGYAKPPCHPVSLCMLEGGSAHSRNEVIMNSVHI